MLISLILSNKGFYYFCFSNGIVNNKSKLAPIVKSSTAQNLTLTNVGLHNKKDAVHEDKVDLDQTTMIGSALDLDSLESGEDSARFDVCAMLSNNNCQTFASS